MKKGKFGTRQPNEAQTLSSVTDAELTTSAPFFINTMLAASASFSDDVSTDAECNPVPADQVSTEADEYKYKYNIEVRSKKDLGINMAGVSKIIIFK